MELLFGLFVLDLILILIGLQLDFAGPGRRRQSDRTSWRYTP
jgi:hypothetical protein